MFFKQNSFVRNVWSILRGEAPSRSFSIKRKHDDSDAVMKDMVQQFLDHHGYDSIEYHDMYGTSPLHRACSMKINSGPSMFVDKSSPTRFFASVEKRQELVKYILENGGSQQLMSKDASGWTPLHHALCCEGLVRILVQEYRANVNAADYSGQTALHIITRDQLWGEADARTGDLAVIQLLLDHGADIEARDFEGWTPLLRACREGNVSVVKFLAEKGANVRCRASEGRTPLHLLLQPHRGGPCKSSDLRDVLELLVKGGANVNAQDKYGFTPLHQATLKGRGDIVRYLIEFGADPSLMTNDYHMTALHLASHHDQFETFQVLLEYSPDLSAVTLSGDTVLHLATTAPIAQCILENSLFHSAKDRACLLHIRNKNGQTPLDVVKQRLNEESAEASMMRSLQLKDYLESYTECSLAVPGSDANDMMDIDPYEHSVKLNLKLNEFQAGFARGTLDMLLQTKVHSVAYTVMGYLSPADVMRQ